MLAGKAADVEQPRLGCLETRRVERQRVGSARDPVFGITGLDDRAVERRQCLGKQRMVGGSALDPACGEPELRKCAVRSAEKLVETGQGFSGLQPGLHQRPLFRKPGLLAGLWGKGIELSQRMRQIVAVALRRRQLRPRLDQLALDPGHMGPGLGDFRDVEPAEHVQQGPVPACVQKSAVVLLAVDLDGQGADSTLR